jgi:hypothetical protein
MAEPSRSLSPWLGVPVAIVATWTLSAQAPSVGSDFEGRLRALESMVKRGPGNSTRIIGPLSVVGTDGKAILHVGPDRDPTVPVNIFRRADNMGGIVSVQSGGLVRAVMGVEADAVGVISALDTKEKPRAQMVGRGAVVIKDERGEQIVGLTRGEGGCRIGLWRGNVRIADLFADPAKGGAPVLRLTAASGQALAEIGTDPNNGSAGAVMVAGSAGKTTAAMLGGLRSAGAVVVATSSGTPVAELSVSSDGRGLVQVFGPGQRPMAVLTRAIETSGGLLQISNNTGPVANLTVGGTGSGYLQLNNAGGQPTLEAGTLPSGSGHLRVGPFWKCSPIKAATPVIGVPGFEDCLVGSTSSK